MKIKKRRKIPDKTLKIYDTIYELEKVHPPWDNCGMYFSWIEKQIKVYNKKHKTRFKDNIVLTYINYKANLEKER